MSATLTAPGTVVRCVCGDDLIVLGRQYIHLAGTCLLCLRLPAGHAPAECSRCSCPLPADTWPHDCDWRRCCGCCDTNSADTW